MTPEEKQEKFSEIEKTLQKAYEDGTLDKAIDTVFDIIFGDLIEIDQNHFGTFAEFKHIDKLDKPILPDNVISRSSCGWATCDIQEAIRRAKDADKRRDKKKVR